ncbi:Pentatricopeptide repeat-containing protein At1g08070, chloroplastic [Linum perenne]
MRREEVVIDKFVAASMLSACTGIGSLEKGKWIHKHIQENGIEMDSKLATAIVDIACKKHNEVEIGEGIGEKMVELEPSNSGRYVLLANLYEDVGELEDIGKAARKLMYESGVSKEPGVSKIEVGGVIREFTAGGRAEKEVYDKVKEMLQRVRYVHKGYKEDESSEYHSEKLAMAFGLTAGVEELEGMQRLP